MSRAFVKEQDDIPEELPERPVSAAPNVVTPRGLRLIDQEITACRRVLAQAQQAQDKPSIARASRDLRYWTLRRSTAQVIEPPAQVEAVGFGARVTIVRDDGRRQVFSIVGEDEAEPSKGLIGYTSPLARALMGKGEGDVAEIPGGEAEIVLLEPVGPEG
jgi:transcription elongation GreA/GreB family factor